MNRVHLAIVGVLLIAAGFSIGPTRTTHFPLIVQGETWAVPSSPPAPSSSMQIVAPQAVSQDLADEYQQLLERLEAALQDNTVVYGPGTHRLPIILVIQDTDDSYNLEENADGNGR